MQKRLGSVLKAGDRVECEGYLVIVIDALPRRVGRVRIIRREQEPLQPDDGSAQTPPDVRTN